MMKTFPFFWVLVSWLGLSAQDVSVEGERHLGFGELRLWEGFGHPREKEFSLPKKIYHTAEELEALDS